MPCDPEKMKKLDAMLDEFLASRKDSQVEEDDDEEEADSEREELKTGALGKKE